MERLVVSKAGTAAGKGSRKKKGQKGIGKIDAGVKSGGKGPRTLNIRSGSQGRSVER